MDEIGDLTLGQFSGFLESTGEMLKNEFGGGGEGATAKQSGGVDFTALSKEQRLAYAKASGWKIIHKKKEE